MTMAASGVAKLIEELGELQQVLGKRLAMWDKDEHWDGTNLKRRMEEEFGDVLAAMSFVQVKLELDDEAIEARMQMKTDIFILWETDPDNNRHGIA